MKTWQFLLLLLGGLTTLGLIGIAALYAVGFFEPTPSAALPPAAPAAPIELPTSQLQPLSNEPFITSTSLPTAAIQTLVPILTFTPYATGTSFPSLTPILPGQVLLTQETVSVDCIPNQTPERGIASDVIDGENIEVLLSGMAYRVHYIGVDAPESAPYSDRAAQANRSMVLGQSVTVYKDQTDKDQEGHLLRYVVMGKTFVNYQLVRQGLTQTLRIPPNIACSSLFETAQTEAQADRLGIWKVPQSPTLPISVTATTQPTITGTP